MTYRERVAFDLKQDLALYKLTKRGETDRVEEYLRFMMSDFLNYFDKRFSGKISISTNDLVEVRAIARQVQTNFGINTTEFAASPISEETIAVIRVTIGDGVQAMIDAPMEEDICTSPAYCQHINEALGLSKLWNLSEDEVTAELRKVITVKVGKEPDLYVIVCNGLEHDLAVKIIDELCVFASTRAENFVHNNGKPQKLFVSIVQPAK